MSHEHIPFSIQTFQSFDADNICMQCGCGYEKRAHNGCATLLEDTWPISCLNKDAKMNEVPHMSRDQQSQPPDEVKPEPRQAVKYEGQEHTQQNWGKMWRVAPEDEVGTFDIGRPVTIDVQEVIDKGPGFEARLKNMEGKAPMSLLSPIFIEGICAVLAHGSKKYAPNMWRDDPMTFTAELNSIFRHLFAFLRCEDYDAAPPSGSGLLHLFNAACRLMFLTERYFTHPELDDRYPAPGLDDEMFQEEMEARAEAQYEEEHGLDDLSRQELYDIIKELNDV